MKVLICDMISEKGIELLRKKDVEVDIKTDLTNQELQEKFV